jgi:hypothetical protein
MIRRRKSSLVRRTPAQQGQIAAVHRFCFTLRAMTSRGLSEIFQIGQLCAF